jgi:hypothetical protein
MTPAWIMPVTAMLLALSGLIEIVAFVTRLACAP